MSPFYLINSFISSVLTALDQAWDFTFLVCAFVLVDLLVEDLAHSLVVVLDRQQVFLGQLGPVEEVHDQLAVFGFLRLDVGLCGEKGLSQFSGDALFLCLLSKFGES